MDLGMILVGEGVLSARIGVEGVGDLGGGQPLGELADRLRRGVIVVVAEVPENGAGDLAQVGIGAGHTVEADNRPDLVVAVRLIWSLSPHHSWITTRPGPGPAPGTLRYPVAVLPLLGNSTIRPAI